MANAVANASFRGDLNTYVMEAFSLDRMFIGAQVFPVFGVSTREGQYPKFTIPRSQLQRNVATERAPDGSYGEITRQFVRETYSTVDRGLEERVDDAYKADFARYFDAERIAALQTLNNVRMAHEVRVAAQLYNSNNFAATSAVVAYTAGNLATVDFIRDVQNRIESLNSAGVIPNAIVMSDTVANFVKRTTLFQNFVKPYGVSPSGAQPTDSTIAAAFADLGIERLLIGRIAVDNSKNRTTASLSKVWGNDFIWVGNIQSGDPFAGGAGRTFTWNEEGGVFVTESYRDEKRRSDMVRVRQHTDEKVIDGNAGRLIQTSFA